MGRNGVLFHSADAPSSWDWPRQSRASWVGEAQCLGNHLLPSRVYACYYGEIASEVATGLNPIGRLIFYDTVPAPCSPVVDEVYRKLLTRKLETWNSMGNGKSESLNKQKGRNTCKNKKEKLYGTGYHQVKLLTSGEDCQVSNAILFGRVSSAACLTVSCVHPLLTHQDVQGGKSSQQSFGACPRPYRPIPPRSTQRA